MRGWGEGPGWNSDRVQGWVSRGPGVGTGVEVRSEVQVGCGCGMGWCFGVCGGGVWSFEGVIQGTMPPG